MDFLKNPSSFNDHGWNIFVSSSVKQWPRTRFECVSSFTMTAVLKSFLTCSSPCTGTNQIHRNYLKAFMQKIRCPCLNEINLLKHHDTVFEYNAHCTCTVYTLSRWLFSQIWIQKQPSCFCKMNPLRIRTGADRLSLQYCDWPSYIFITIY